MIISMEQQPERQQQQEERSAHRALGFILHTGLTDPKTEETDFRFQVSGQNDQDHPTNWESKHQRLHQL